MSDKKTHTPLVHTDRVSLLIRNRTGNIATVPSADVIASSQIRVAFKITAAADAVHQIDPGYVR